MHLQTDYLVIGAGVTGLCFADELLTAGHRAAVQVVLVFVMHVTAQKAFGVAAMGE